MLIGDNQNSLKAGLRGPTLQALHRGRVAYEPNSQAQLFWRSQTVAEKRHIIVAFRFELSRVTVPAIRERVVSPTDWASRCCPRHNRWRCGWSTALMARACGGCRKCKAAVIFCTYCRKTVCIGN